MGREALADRWQRWIATDDPEAWREGGASGRAVRRCVSIHGDAGGIQGLPVVAQIVEVRADGRGSTGSCVAANDIRGRGCGIRRRPVRDQAVVVLLFDPFVDDGT